MPTNDSTQAPLKPCPFCGGKPKTQRNRAGGLHIFCDENYCIDPDGEGEHDGQDEDIIRLWNTRPLEARAETALADMVAERDEMKRQRDLYAEGLKKEEADCEALEAENARLKAPVSDEEWAEYSTLFYDGTDHDYDEEAIKRGNLDTLISRRGGK
jgi:hypothetical protein